MEPAALVQLERADHARLELHVVVVGLDAAAHAVDDGFEIAELAHVGAGPAEGEGLVPAGRRRLLLRRLADDVGAGE